MPLYRSGMSDCDSTINEPYPRLLKIKIKNREIYGVPGLEAYLHVQCNKKHDYYMGYYSH